MIGFVPHWLMRERTASGWACPSRLASGPIKSASFVASDLANSRSPGQLAGPPEDCGGIPGFYDLLDALDNPSHERHEELSDWIGEDFDPQAFSLDLARISHRFIADCGDDRQEKCWKGRHFMA